MQDHAGKGGFTLIELLVVVAIIALLLAILLPALSRVRAQARMAKCRSNERQFGVAMTIFTAEHQGRVPRGLSRHGPSGDPTGPVNWVRMVARLFGDKKSYAANFNRVPVEKFEVFSCPARAQEYPGTFLDYVVNSMDHRGPIELTGCSPAPTTGKWYEAEGVTKINVWKRPAEVIYVTEAVRESWDIEDPNNSNRTLGGIRENIESIRAEVPPRQTGFDWFDVPGGMSIPTYREFTGSGSRLPRAAVRMHLSRGSNGVFADGHVELVKPPPRNVGLQTIHEFYLRKFGVDPDVIDGCTALETTATTGPCAVGDTKWRP